MTNEKENQINELNATIKVRIGVSKIEGVGVIAITKIREGEKCYCFPAKEKWYNLSWGSLGKLFPHVEKIIKDQWPSIINGSHFPSPNFTTWPILYMNHSDNPNYDIITDTALQDIQEGEELTEDYKKMTNWEKAFPWLSGKDNLIGRKIHWANKSGNYYRNLVDWLRLCVKCHKAHDRK